ncbi:ROK family protein [Trueperella pyogenes]|uniref:ROK family protein n=1 Tax=Trueperella pyogenes TaxID=1661 RepID=UPI00345CDD07
MKPPQSTPSAWFDASVSDWPASHVAVLNYAWGRKEFTASDVMANTGLTRATSIDVLEVLADSGLIVELPNAREACPRVGATAHARVVGQVNAPAAIYRKGRPARRFSFDADAGLVVGVDAGCSHLTAIAADLSGQSVATAHSVAECDPDGDVRVLGPRRREQVRSLIAEAVKQAGRDPGDIYAVCVGVPAPVADDGRSPRHHTGFWQLVNPDLIDELADVGPVVRVENDALLAAVAEGTVGEARGQGSFVTLLAGARMGAGVVIDGHLLRGTHGAVGEMNAFDCVEGVGDTFGFGEYAAKAAAKEIAAGHVDGNGAFGGLAPEEVTGRLVFAAIEAGDADAQAIARDIGRRLARVVTVLQSFYDPAMVVVSGAVGPAMLKVIEEARAAMPDSGASIAPDVVGSRLGAEAVVTGAVAAAVQMACASALDIAVGK